MLSWLSGTDSCCFAVSLSRATGDNLPALIMNIMKARPAALPKRTCSKDMQVSVSSDRSPCLSAFCVACLLQKGGEHQALSHRIVTGLQVITSLTPSTLRSLSAKCWPSIRIRDQALLTACVIPVSLLANAHLVKQRVMRGESRRRNPLQAQPCRRVARGWLVSGAAAMALQHTHGGAAPARPIQAWQGA